MITIKKLGNTHVLDWQAYSPAFFEETFRAMKAGCDEQLLALIAEVGAARETKSVDRHSKESALIELIRNNDLGKIIVSVPYSE